MRSGYFHSPRAFQGNADREPVIWFEVEDFLRYFDHFRNPTGLQRVPFEIYVEAVRLYGRAGRVRFCRLSIYSKQLRAISFDAISSAYLKPPGARAPWRTIWAPAKLLSSFPSMLPVIIRNPRFFLSIFKTALRDLIGMSARRNSFEQFVRPGDIIVSLGAGWGVPHYVKHIAEAKRRYGIKFSTLIHDLIPLEYESLVEQRHVVQFRNWLQEALPIADVVLTTSKHSRNALIKLASDAGWSLPRVEVVEPGSGLNNQLMSGDQGTVNLPQRYVLFVSTIEIRKNHRLLVRIWRRLYRAPRCGCGACLDLRRPDRLVGRRPVGRAFGESIIVDGKIVLMPGLSDAELRQAYRSSLFTVFPSLCEGWGLPIAESLMHGKFCVASNRTSIPEVGGDLVDYFDPCERGRCARQNRAPVARSRLSEGAGGAAAGRIPAPDLDRLRSCAHRQARTNAVGGRRRRGGTNPSRSELASARAASHHS